jgi:hypothetical protein
MLSFPRVIGTRLAGSVPGHDIRNLVKQTDDAEREGLERSLPSSTGLRCSRISDLRIRDVAPFRAIP